VPQIDKGDFLKKDAHTPLAGQFLIAGILLSIETNSEALLNIANEEFRRFAGEHPTKQVRLRLWVDPSAHSSPPWPKPFFRGLGHLVYAGFDTKNSLLIDLRKQHLVGRLTQEMASDRVFWKTVIFPVILAVVGASAGLTILHCACVAWKGSGLLIAGASGSGKSTLSLALAQKGFDFLSDDRTLISFQNGRLLAWSFTPFLKLRTETASHFSELNTVEPLGCYHNEQVFHLDPTERFKVSRIQCCEPRWVFFLERQSDPAFNLDQASRNEAAAQLEEGIPQETPAATQLQRATIDKIVERECWVLRHGGDPHTIAWAIRGFVAAQKDRKPLALSIKPEARGAAPRCDPLRRFTPTPHVVHIRVMRRTIRLETNSRKVLTQVRRAFECRENPHEAPQFVWKIVSENKDCLKLPWPEMTAFSDGNLRYVNIGQRSFIAVDLESREAVSFVSEELATDDVGFSGVFLATLFYLTASALGLTAISAACVATGDRGLLLFGVPNSGKTTSSYLAQRHGLEFHADQATFLELNGRTLCAWGDFWPAAFRVESAKFLPELQELTRPLFHRDITFLCLEKSLLGRDKARSVVPAACIFLERHAHKSPRLIPLPTQDFVERLENAAPFKEEAVTKSDRSAVFRTLAGLPAYRLLYGSDPAVPALILRSVLSTHTHVEGLE
jgi:hypothetical protein